jgi:hypothetical protein
MSSREHCIWQITGMRDVVHAEVKPDDEVFLYEDSLLKKAWKLMGELATLAAQSSLPGSSVSIVERRSFIVFRA